MCWKLELSKDVAVLFFVSNLLSPSKVFLTQLLLTPNVLQVPCLVLTGADRKNSNPFNVNRGLVLTKMQGMSLSLDEETDVF